MLQAKAGVIAATRAANEARAAVSTLSREVSAVAAAEASREVAAAAPQPPPPDNAELLAELASAVRELREARDPAPAASAAAAAVASAARAEAAAEASTTAAKLTAELAASLAGLLPRHPSQQDSRATATPPRHGVSPESAPAQEEAAGGAGSLQRRRAQPPAGLPTRRSPLVTPSAVLGASPSRALGVTPQRAPPAARREAAVGGESGWPPAAVTGRQGGRLPPTAAPAPASSMRAPPSREPLRRLSIVSAATTASSGRNGRLAYRSLGELLRNEAEGLDPSWLG